MVDNKNEHILDDAIDDENLTPAELNLLKRGLKEALVIKEGKLQSIPFSKLWND